MKRILSALFAALMVTTAFAGCGSSNSSSVAPTTPDASAGDAAPGGETPPAPGVGTGAWSTPASQGKQELIFSLQNEPDGLDPNVTNNSFAAPFLDNLFEGLVTYDQDNNLAPGNAESWTISDDGLTYTFKLRSGLKWSDGSPLTSGDYLYSMKRILTPETAAQYLNMLTDYVVNAQEFFEGKCTFEDVGLKAPDDTTFVMTLKAPTPYYLGILAMYTFVPTNQSVVEAAPEQWSQSAEKFVSNGPFMMSEYNFGKSIVLVKNPNYWDAANVKLEKLTFRYILDQSTALSAFESGEVDGIRFIPPADMPRLKAESDAFQVVPMFGSTYYLFNNENEVLKDVRVRQALAMALDRTALVENVLQSTDSPAFALVSDGYMVDGKDYTEGRSNYGLAATAQVEEAKKLLAEAGYPDGQGFPKLRLGYYSDTTVKKMTEAMQQMWKDNLGIETEITVADWKVYYDAIQKGDYDIGAMGWGADYLHPMSFYPLFFTNDVSNNSRYSNPAYDELVNKAKSIVDPVEAVTVMRQAEDTLMADMPFCPIYYRSISFMMRPEVVGYNMSPLNQPYFKGCSIDLNAAAAADEED